ncbi:MAG: Ig-like domain-containing protein, partial [Myxococcales bacterium]
TAQVKVDAAALVALAVTPPVTASLPQGVTQQLAVSGTYSDGSTRDITSEVLWATSDAELATVALDGMVTGHKPGAVTLSASHPGWVPGAGNVGGEAGLITSSAQVTVTDAELRTIEVSPVDRSLPKGLSARYTAVGIYSDQTSRDISADVTWSSSAPTIASIDDGAEKGTVTALAVGTTEITATRGAVSGKATLTVAAAKLQQIQLTPPAPSLAKGTTLELVATGVYSDRSTHDITSDVTWASSDASIVSVDGGELLGVDEGSATVSAEHEGVRGEVVVSVTAAELTALQITPAAPSLPIGTTLELKATGVYSDSSTQDLTDQVSWTSSSTALATVGNTAGQKGRLTGVAKGTATITAKQGAVEAQVQATITDAVLTAIDLGNEKVRLRGYQLRLRRLVVQPGGEVPVHSHENRPALIYIAEGEMTEFKNICAVPIVHKAGEATPEDHRVVHWWRNTGRVPAVILSADVFGANEDAHVM